MKLYMLFIFGCLLQAQDNNWDVSLAHTKADSITFTASEGTWMNLDISPDGRQIVFDLLGDIYIMPLAGGEATLLAGGPAYELQPRFSPDGSKISFTSDRAGGDNIWLMNRDGSAKTQVSKENFRLLNNAVWTNDGQYLIARKHFTSTRSLGAGEMWMYHISGGTGLQLTERKNDQQDVNEPSLSPDGKYLYFSEDMYPGGAFQYNKNVHDRIYRIRRYDMDTGEIKNIIAPTGGAARPVLSPDGQTIAFVRRVRMQSVLCLYDIKSGQTTALYDDLSKDQQETWAIFGVYPNFDWTPDGKSIVFWSKGKIRRVNIATKAVSEIPFTVKVSKTVAQALRFKHKVFSETFTAKMIRHAVTAPDGKSIVFSAVGHLWKKVLPDGQPQRLTESSQREFEPSFSPDGRWIVFATWDDQQLGTISKVDAAGGKAVKITIQPGYYHTPRFSHDGKKIVYLRDTGDNVLGHVYSTDPGIYICSSNGKDHKLVSEQGYNPSFSKDNQRLYIHDATADGLQYKSINLNGNDDRILFKSKYAVDVVPSPDENWLAFKELYQVYVIPFPRTGQTTDLSAGMESLPVKKVSRDAGRDLHWSWDSNNLHWLNGPHYFSRSLKETFTFVPGAPDSLPAIDTSGIAIGLNIKSDIPDGRIAFKGARIITMAGDQVIDDGVLVVNKNIIEQVGSAAEITIPADARVIDVSGKTILPGLIDVHAHLANHWSSSGIYPQQDWSYFVNLAYGVTTTHDPSTNTEMSFGQAELVRAGLMTGPRIYSTGTILYGADGNFKAVINSLDDARSHIRRLKAVGAFSVKSYNQPRREQRQQIIKAADELAINVYPEGGSFFFHNMTMIFDGHTGIEHSIPIGTLYDDVINVWAASGSGYTPTLIVGYGGLWGENYWYKHMKVWEQERLLKFTPRSIIDPRSIRREIAPEEDYGHIEIAEAAKKLSDAGVKVNLGAHGQLQGLGVHWELWMLAQGGMTAMEALRCATINGAHYLGMEDDIGSLETGKLADLIVLDKNPLENIRDSRYVNMVMVNGRLYDAATMNETGNHPHTRNNFWWENNPDFGTFEWHENSRVNGCGCDMERH